MEQILQVSLITKWTFPFNLDGKKNWFAFARSGNWCLRCQWVFHLSISPQNKLGKTTLQRGPCHIGNRCIRNWRSGVPIMDFRCMSISLQAFLLREQHGR